MAEYLAVWERESESVLGWHDEGVMQYPAPLAVTWQRSSQQLSPTAQAILQLVSFLAPDPIPSEMFEAGEEIVRQAAALVSDEAPGKLRDDLAELKSLSLISGQGEHFTVHRLMQEAVRNHIPEDGQAAWIELILALLARYAPFQADDANNGRPGTSCVLTSHRLSSLPEGGTPRKINSRHGP